MKLLSWFLLLVLTDDFAYSGRWRQRLNKLTDKKFSQGKSELVFLLDRSGSVGAANFEIEKGFVENLLTNFVIAPNATRVAVITYSRTATLHIDYIKSPKNKCFFSEEIQQVAYEGSEQTNTAAALLTARNVLFRARKNVNKVIILLSDGISTAGKDPVQVAKLLKADNVEIFTFAIGKFLRVELDAIATDSNHTFSTVSFRKFRKLAKRVRGDPHETKWQSSLSKKSCDYLCDSPYAGQAFDPGCCDSNAKCTCGLVSGLYNCICGPGYFGESGLIGGCKSCPIGTYKNNYEPAYACTKCPRKSTTAKEASTSLADCQCILGYNGDPSRGKFCKINKCPPLQKPTNGRILGNCKRKYKSVCYFSCDEGYKVSDRDGEERTCKADKTWSGITTTCTQIRCENLETPKFGSKNCSTTDNSWKTVCNFKCNNGFIFMGSKSRTCESGGQWSGYQPECEIVRCPVLQQLQHGRITPATCVNQQTEFNKPCFFHCYQGFSRVGPQYMVCNKQGIWEGRLATGAATFQVAKCEDVERPRSDCPLPIKAAAEPGVNFAWVAWRKPKFWDNSGLKPKVEWKPNYQKENAKFTMGEHKITYKASDASFHTTVCEVKITVIDREPPRVISCPTDILANTTELEEPIFWDEPRFKDNSNEDLKIISSYTPGDKFQAGKWLVYYMATDSHNNDVTCEFNIIVKKNTCPYYPAPVNGALTCSDWLRGEFCQVYCNARFEFAKKPATWYICNPNSNWKTIPDNSLVPWPDCSEWYIPKAVRKLLGHYFTGNCAEKKVQDTIKRSFIKYFKSKFDTSKFCKGDRSCKVESVTVKCGALNNSISVGRQKRELPQQLIQIELDIIVEADSQASQTKSLISELVNSANSLLVDSDFKEAEIADEIENEGITVIQEKGITVEETVLTCDAGQIKKHNECVNCPVGTYYKENSCKKCPVGYFQNDEAQLACKKCPEGQWTIGDHNRNFTECKDICKAGTYSVTGLATCTACPRGTYQDQPGKNECMRCPARTTTWIVQADNSSYCREKCLRGSYSDTGLGPCTSCPVGYYQENHGQQYCKDCPGQLSTLGKGSISRSACLQVNHCIQHKCENGGQCKNSKNHYSCACPQGYYGPTCRNETDACKSSPCQHNSTCVNKVGDFECICSKGFSGKRCEKEVNECFLFPCLNGGTCIDKVANYKCFCTSGYSGDRCQVDLDMCEGSPCGEHGQCTDTGDDFKCNCDVGFEGDQCETNLNDCVDVTCENGGRCVDGWNNYTCACQTGYAGKHCEQNINDCINHDCQNGATCVDLLNAHQCSCRPGYSGRTCNQRLGTDFLLTFEKAKLSNCAMLDKMPNLKAFTVDAWVQATSEDRRAATILSYAVKDARSQLLDNALSIMDAGDIKIFINNKPIYTDLELDDGRWHRITVSWSGATNGAWSIYLDGAKVNSGSNVAVGETIIGGGMLVIGQDQDNIGGNFNIMESFIGNISSINIWDKVLAPQDLGDTCKRLGLEDPNLMVAWSDFLAGVHGDVKVVPDTCP